MFLASLFLSRKVCWFIEASLSNTGAPDKKQQFISSSYEHKDCRSKSTYILRYIICRYICFLVRSFSSLLNSQKWCTMYRTTLKLWWMRMAINKIGAPLKAILSLNLKWKKKVMCMIKKRYHSPKPKNKWKNKTYLK